MSPSSFEMFDTTQSLLDFNFLVINLALAIVVAEDVSLVYEYEFYIRNVLKDIEWVESQVTIVWVLSFMLCNCLKGMSFKDIIGVEGNHSLI